MAEKTLMITGASLGLGRALALAFAGKGTNLALCARNSGPLDEVKALAEAKGAKVLAVSADVSEARDADRFVSLAEKEFGKIDLLINNASVLGPSPMPLLADYPQEDFHEVIRVNTMSAFIMTQRVLPGMFLRNSGTVIFVTSEAGSTGFAGWGAYGISKFAVEGMAQTWADELSDTGISIHLVDPGEMDTMMHRLAVPECDYPLKKPEEAVPVFLYLAEGNRKGFHGQRLEADVFSGGGNDDDTKSQL